MTHFALIERNSGFVWWVGDADTAEHACWCADVDINGEGRDYARIPSGDWRTLAGGYAVHTAPEGFDVDDGQDADAIAAVEAMPLAGYYRATPEGQTHG